MTLLLAGLALGQVTPPGARPPASTLPARPDTAQIRVAVPDSLPQPTSVVVVQDTLIFGGYLHLILDYDAEPSSVSEPVLVAEGQWLTPVPMTAGAAWYELWHDTSLVPEVDLSSLPTVAGTRIVVTFRVYRRDPLQIVWRDYVSPVLFVRGQTDGMDQTATIRQPQSIAWTPWRLIGAALLVLVLIVLLYGWWRRRNRPPPLQHWQPADPAWLEMAVGLQKLIKDDVLARGQSRLFLDRLASLTRDYVAARYHIAAREMTGEEMVTACQNLGYDLLQPRGFANLIKISDRERYNPADPALPLCREQVVDVFRRVEAVRLRSQYATVAATRQLAADHAWTDLVRELGDPRGLHGRGDAQEVG